jgi:hypothetical protein
LSPPGAEIGFQPAFDSRGLDISWLATRVGEMSSVEIKYWRRAGWTLSDPRHPAFDSKLERILTISQTGSQESVDRLHEIRGDIQNESVFLRCRFQNLRSV